MAKTRKLLKGVKSLLDDAAEKVGTSTMRRTRRQTKRPSNVVQRDAKTGRVRAVSRGERVKRGKDIGKTVGATTGVIGAGAAAATGAKSLDPSSKADKKESKSSTAKTRSQTAGKKGTIKKERIGSGRSMYMLDGRLNISKENLKDSGMTLTEYANYMQKNKKRPPKAKVGRKFGNTESAYKKGAKKKAMGGMMKSKMASKGGAKGGKRMPPGMKAGGSASKFPDLSGDGKVTQKDILMGKGVIKKQAGGMMKSKMSSKGGAKGGRKPGGMRRGGMARSPLARARRGAGGGPVAGAANMQRLAKQALKGFGGGGGFQSQAGGKPALQGGAGGFQSQAGGLAAQQAAGAQAAQAAGGRRRRRQAGGPSGGRMGAMAGMGGAMPQQQLTAQFMANGGMAKKKPKGYAKGGASTKKGFSKGGSVRGKPRGVGAAMRGFGKAMKK
jgi:hypothetical protein